MKKLLLLLAIIPLFTNAQDNSKKIGKNISIGLNFSPNYNYRNLLNAHDDQSIGTFIAFRDEREIGKLGYSTGANVNFALSKKFEFQVGLFYSDKGYKTKKVAVDTPWSTVIGIAQHMSIRKADYLDVPLKLNYISGEGRLKFIAGAGVSVNFLLNHSVKTTFLYTNGNEETKKSSDVDLNKFNISALASVGLQYRLKENIFLRAEPTFQYGILKVNDRPLDGTAEYLWNVGLNVGVHLRLK